LAVIESGPASEVGGSDDLFVIRKRLESMKPVKGVQAAGRPPPPVSRSRLVALPGHRERYQPTHRLEAENGTAVATLAAAGAGCTAAEAALVTVRIISQI